MSFFAAQSLPRDIVRDSEYYYSTGDCTILISNTLFRVHKAFLSRDKSVFNDMFDLPLGPDLPSLQNNTDEDPLVLHDDTVNQFRALCWALYALPPEILEQSSKRVNMSRMMDLSVIAHKYNFEAIAGWCNDVLLHHCRAGIRFLSTCSTAEMESLANLTSYDNGTDELCQIIQVKWLERLKTRALPVSHALTVGERLSWRDFLGKAYYEQLCQMRANHLNNVTLQVSNLDETDLGEKQKYHLLRGFYSLSIFWDNFAKRRASTDIGSPCTNLPPASSHRDHCSANIPKLWDEVFADLSRSHRAGSLIGDVLGNLRYIIHHIPSVSIPNLFCQTLIAKRVQDIHDDLVKTLADHFLGPITEPTVNVDTVP